MSKKKVVVLGGTGMLCSMVVDLLLQESQLSVTATARSLDDVATFQEKNPSVQWKSFDAESIATIEADLEDLIANAWVVNAIGIIKPYIKDDSSSQVQRALLVNGLFPHKLASVAERKASRVIQIATDCVYTGQKGKYQEKDLYDATDVYGKTKVLMR